MMLPRSVSAMEISIHAPCTGSDGFLEQPLCPADIISIHAPCTGSDIDPLTNVAISCDFNPRSLHGERPAKRTKCREGADFNPRSLHGERPA